MTGADAWQQATADLEAAVRRSQQAERELRERPDFQQRVDDVETYARSRAAPRALRDLQRRVDGGELSWYAITAGEHLDDPDVRAALDGGVTEPIQFDDEAELPAGRGYAFMRFDPDAAE